MRFILFTILMLFLGQLAFNFADSFIDDEEEISMTSEESEDGESEEKIEYEKESTKNLTGHGSIELYLVARYANENESNMCTAVSIYPAVYVNSPYFPPDRTC